MSVLYVVLALVAIQRIAELAYAERNTRALLARGASEYAPWQHPFFVALHAAWLLALLAFVPAHQPPHWALIAVFFVLQGLRVWVLATLGPAWTTRIISLPGAPLVRSGPYRWIRHPNYTIVAAEIAVLPLAFGAVAIATVFTVLNAALLVLRIRAEEEALASRYSR
ncbi:MAG TPA: isoprenylcysteine carboxylmethyltransferase family protein [Candidatus Baltobacteraceae bacterium]|nr:isoprenylcysteine carboxylmethyltransferase family protein [Candidatus Baltobacteraceae bacterium]